MTCLSEHPRYEQWIQRLPSPLAISLDRLKGARKSPSEAFSATLDVFLTALRWTAYVGIADVVHKLKTRHPLAATEAFREALPSIAKILEPTAQHGHWVGCARSIVEAYRSSPGDFFLPELIEAQAKTEEDPLRIEQKLDSLVSIRNDYAHGARSRLSPSEASGYFAQADEMLGWLFEQLKVFEDYRLIQFNSMYEAEGGGRGWYRFPSHLELRGAATTNSAILKEEERRLHFGASPPYMDRLYLFDWSYRRFLELDPFVIFDYDGNLGPARCTFLFNVLKKETLYYHTLEQDPAAREKAGRHGVPMPPDRPLDARVRERYGPRILQYFRTLRTVAGDTELTRLQPLAAQLRQSHVLDFRRIVDFHTESFTGRLECFQAVEAAVQSEPGAFRSLWVSGLAGYGKTAFVAALAERYAKTAIPYFITADESTADATTFLWHVCESIIDRFRFQDEIPPTETLEGLRERFVELLGRVDQELEGGRRKLILLIDGLDESYRYASRPEEVIANVLPSSRAEIPKHVFFLFSSRPDVDLGKLSDVTVALKPFSRDEVAGILGQYGWSAEDSARAYEKSKGQPLYFRFLLDGIKRGTLALKDVARLPEGIEGFYRRFWVQAERDRAQRKSREKAVMGEVSIQLLGLLAAAQASLTVAELERLVGHVIPDDLPGLPEDGEWARVLVRRALAKDRLGRFVIGSDRLSLFHDTLRQYVLEQTRPKGDSSPYGGGLAYHQRMAQWCRQRFDPAYAQRYLAYHLLHGRNYEELVGLFADTSESGRFRRSLALEDGGGQLSRDLHHATMAARELNRLDLIFELSLLKLTVAELRRSTVVPEGLRVLLKLGDDAGVDAMLQACDEPDEEIKLACAAYAHALSEADPQGAGRWADHLRAALRKARGRGEPSTLLAQLEAPTRESVLATLELFEGLDADDRAVALTEAGQACAPEHAELFAGLVLESQSDYFWRRRSEHVFGLAATLLAADPRSEAAWRLLGQVAVDEDLPLPLVELFLAEDAERTLGSLQVSGMDLDSWVQVGWFCTLLRVLSRRASRGAVEAWLGTLPLRQSVISACWSAAGVDGDAASVDVAEERFIAGGADLSAVATLACLGLLSRARRIYGPEGSDRWRPLVLEQIDGVGGAVSVATIEDGDELEKDAERLMPLAGSILREVEPFFPDRMAAFWFSMAAASPALEAMLDPRVQDWIRRRVDGSGGTEQDPVLRQVVERLGAKVMEKLSHSNDRDDIQRLVLPLLFSLLDDDDVAGRIKAHSPFERLAFHRGEFLCLYPGGPDRLVPLWPWLVDEDGDPVVSSLMEEWLRWRITADPEPGTEILSELPKVDDDEIRRERARLGLKIDRRRQLEGQGLMPAGEPGRERESVAGVLDSEELALLCAQAGMTEAELRELEAGSFDEDDTAGWDADGDDGPDWDEDDDDGLAWDDEDDDGPGAVEDGEVLPTEADDAAARSASSIADKDLVLPLHAAGQTRQAIRMALAEGPPGDWYWGLIGRGGPGPKRELLEELTRPEVELGWRCQGLDRCLVYALSGEPRVAQREWLARLLGSDAVRSDLGGAVVGAAVRLGHVDLVLETLRARLSKGKRVDDDELLGSFAVQWIEAQLEEEPRLAARMWEEYRAYLRAGGLSFLEESERTFDQKIAEILEKGAADSRRLEEVASRLPSTFSASRAAAAVVLAGRGAGREIVEPLVDVKSPEDLMSFCAAVAERPPADWVGPWILEICRSLLDGKEVDERGSTASALVPLLAWSALPRELSEELRVRLLGDLEAGLPAARGQDEAKEELLRAAGASGRVLAGDGEGADATLLAAALEKTRIFREASVFDASRVWSAASRSFAGEHVERLAAAIFKHALRQDLPWAVETVLPAVAPENLWGCLLELSEAAGVERWPGVAEDFARALDRLPADFEVPMFGDRGLQLERLLAKAPALFVRVLDRSRDVDDWANFFALQERWEARQVELARLVAEDPVAVERGFGSALMGRFGDMVASRLAKLAAEQLRPQDEQAARALLEVLCSAAEDLAPEARKEVVASLTRELASVWPRMAWDLALRLRYTGRFLDDIAEAVVKEHPDMADEVLRAVGESLDDGDRRDVRAAALLSRPLAEAELSLRQHRISVDRFASGYAKTRPVGLDDLPLLERMIGPKPSERLSLYATCMANAEASPELASECADRALALVRKGRLRPCRWHERYLELHFEEHNDELDHVSDELAPLYAARPGDTERLLRSHAREARPERQEQIETLAGEIRKESLLLLVRDNPEWLFDHLADWRDEPWWPKYLDDDTRREVRKLDPERALVLLSTFDLVDEEDLRDLLDSAGDKDELRECLEVLLSEHVVRHPSDMGKVVDLCFEHAEPAGFDLTELVLGWALSFEKARAMAGVRSLDPAALLGRLARKAGLEAQVEEEADRDESEQEAPDEDDGYDKLTAEERRRLEWLEGHLSEARKKGDECGVDILGGDIASILEAAKAR